MLRAYIRAYSEAIEKRDEQEQHRIEKHVRVSAGMDKITLIILAKKLEQEIKIEVEKTSKH